jgi:enoyl-CoA hydratase/carnithine racemase
VEAEFVRYTVDNDVAVIAIDRPQAANAQNPQMLQELDEAWSLSDRDP